MFEICEIFGNPQKSMKVIHVAGTNGKGTVSLKTATGIQAAGYKVGLFTSPHLYCFRERIKVDGAMISESDFVNLYKHVKDKIQKATFFEITTIIALLYFKNCECDYCVIEVGLGGTNDATNVVRPIACCITSIGYDHMEILGDTIEKIASHKAGIIKHNTPVFVQHDAPHHVFQPIAQSISALYNVVDTEKFNNFVEVNNELALELTKHVLGANLTLEIQ